MRVIGAGFGRTGTHSLKGALETLGFGPCYHMSEVFEHADHAALWTAAAAGETVDWDAVFADYHATVDWPSAAFYIRLMEAFPDAPVILTVRDPESWYESCMQTIYPASAPGTDSELVANGNPMGAMIAAVVWNGTFHGRFRDRAYAVSVFQEHIREVQARVPAERLLVYEVKQGWEPLCRFLGVEVPATPFPHTNTTAEFQQSAARNGGAEADSSDSSPGT